MRCRLQLQDDSTTQARIERLITHRKAIIDRCIMRLDHAVIGHLLCERRMALLDRGTGTRAGDRVTLDDLDRCRGALKRSRHRVDHARNMLERHYAFLALLSRHADHRRRCLASAIVATRATCYR